MIKRLVLLLSASAILLYSTCGEFCLGAEPPQVNPDKAEQSQVQLDDLKYSHPELQKKIERIDAAARRIAGPNWHNIPWHVRQPTPGSGRKSIDYWASWCRQSGKQDHICTTSNERPVHCMYLVCGHLPDDSKTLWRFSVSGRWYPKGDGWGASILYYSYKPYLPEDPGEEKFGIQFLCEKDKRPHPDLSLSIPGNGWWTKKEIFLNDESGNERGPFEYHISVQPYPNMAERNAERFLASPEALRDEGLATLDDLQAVIKEQVYSGQAITGIDDRTKLILDDLDRKPRRIYERTLFEKKTVPAEYALSNLQKKQILSEAIDELDRRRSILREHYKELYAAAMNAFPVSACMDQDDHKKSNLLSE